jgi:hypothetical protein
MHQSMKTRDLALAAFVIGAASLGTIYWWARPQSSSAALVCPETHSRMTAMALKETTADVARASSALSGPEQENTIRVLAAELKRKHPEAGSADIVNYLLTAYCPLVKQENGLSDGEKRAKMDRFSSQVFTIVQ